MPETELPGDSVTCCRCGRVSDALSRAGAARRVEAHNAMRARLPEAERERSWPHPATLERYRCLGCGGWGPYRPAREGDCPSGATVNAVVWDSA